MFKLTIETDNAAFEGDPIPQVVRILTKATALLANGASLPMKLRDVNGNTVGLAELS